jgi:hypothetical protein
VTASSLPACQHPPMNVSGMIWIPHNTLAREAIDAVVFRRIFGKNDGEPATQAIIEDEGDVYAAFAKLPDASSRIFTAWRPDSIQMKLGAILEFIAIDQPAFVVAWPTLVEHVVWPALWPKACSRRYR